MCARAGGGNVPSTRVGTMDSGAADASRDCGSLGVLLVGGRIRSARALAGATGAGRLAGLDCVGLTMTVWTGLLPTEGVEPASDVWANGTEPLGAPIEDGAPAEPGEALGAAGMPGALNASCTPIGGVAPGKGDSPAGLEITGMVVTTRGVASAD